MGGSLSGPGVALSRPWRIPVRLVVQHRLATRGWREPCRDPLIREDLPEGVHTMRVRISHAVRAHDVGPSSTEP